MASEDEKKKYWCDQIKTMLGPCMITFAIPMLVPGFTITFVAFAEEDSFPKYGALHVVGILILAISVILIMLGCFLRFYWKPFIGPDVEMHLSPNVSFRNMRTERTNPRTLKHDKPLKEPTPVAASTRKNSFGDSDKARMDNIPSVSERKMHKSESETEGTGSESDLKKSLTGRTERKFDIMASPRSRNLVPVHSDSHDEMEQNCISQNNFPESESLEALRQFRKKKRRAKKRMQRSEYKEEDEEINPTSQLEKNNDSGKEHKKATEVKKLKRKKKKKKVLNKLRNEQAGTRGDNSHHISSLSEPKVSKLDVFDNRNDNEDSDHSVVSVGSADSVLAQYTSRSSKNQKEEI